MNTIQNYNKNGVEIEAYLSNINMESWHYFFKNKIKKDTIKELNEDKIPVNKTHDFIEK